MRTIAVANQKGGAAKTTTAVNLAAALGEGKRKILLIDLDPQACASAWYGIREEGRGLLDAFLEKTELAGMARETHVPGVTVIPASAWLASVDKSMAGQVGAELVFREQLSALPNRWDIVMIDCPPSLGLLTVSALSAVKEVLVPVETSVMALAGLARLTETVAMVHDRLNPVLSVTGILACRADLRRSLSREVIEAMRDSFPDKVLRTVIRENVRLAEAWSHAKPITIYAPTCHGAADYRAAAKELEERWRKRK